MAHRTLTITQHHSASMELAESGGVYMRIQISFVQDYIVFFYRVNAAVNVNCGGFNSIEFNYSISCVSVEPWVVGLIK